MATTTTWTATTSTRRPSRVWDEDGNAGTIVDTGEGVIYVEWSNGTTVAYEEFGPGEWMNPDTDEVVVAG